MFLKLLFYFESLEKQDFINIINKVILKSKNIFYNSEELKEKMITYIEENKKIQRYYYIDSKEKVEILKSESI